MYDYKTWYINRRNRLCLEHNSVMPKGRCEQCKAISQAKPQIYISQFDFDERLNLAAYLEYKVALGELEIMEARYKLVDQYPETNCIPTTYDRTDISVINLIRPFYTTVHELKRSKRNEGNADSEFTATDSFGNDAFNPYEYPETELTGIPAFT